ncbi:MAG: hypothetical protein HRT56_00820 [Coraliomargarita sp.]|nr:hypothetical protein [Coraliomargarita sp.]
MPKLKFVCISGAGNPDKAPVVDHIQALYPLSSGIKMIAKKPGSPPRGTTTHHLSAVGNLETNR